jgi:hypothetical protein
MSHGHQSVAAITGLLRQFGADPAHAAQAARMFEAFMAAMNQAKQGGGDPMEVIQRFLAMITQLMGQGRQAGNVG